MHACMYVYGLWGMYLQDTFVAQPLPMACIYVISYVAPHALWFTILEGKYVTTSKHVNILAQL